MDRYDTEEVVAAFQRLMETAETFVNRAPRQKRLDAERAVHPNAISHAQPVLSVHRISKRRSKLNTKILFGAEAQTPAGKAVETITGEGKRIRNPTRRSDCCGRGSTGEGPGSQKKRSIHFEIAGAGHSA